MTVIAFDGKTMVADRLNFRHGTFNTAVKKIFHVPSIDGREPFLIGVSGPTVLTHAVVEWARGGFKQEEMPVDQKNPDKFAPAMVVNKKGEIYIYENSHVPWQLEHTIHAIGAGGEIAMGAMLMKATAAQAVEIACEYIAVCGCGTDSLSLSLLDESTD